MPGDTVVLLGFPLSRMGIDAAVQACRRRIEASLGGYVCFVNVHTLTEATSHPALGEALARATYCFADGVPLLWLAIAKRAAIDTRVAGPDFMSEMLRTASDEVHGFIGGVPGRADEIARRFAVRGVTFSSPVRPFSEASAVEDWQRFLERCPDGRPPRIVWVGLGAPKQELWLATVSPSAPDVLFLGVGAAFDFLASAIPRAPTLVRRLGLEWVHRLATEPRRLWRRYLITNSRFLVLSFRDVFEL